MKTAKKIALDLMVFHAREIMKQLRNNEMDTEEVLAAIHTIKNSQIMSHVRSPRFYLAAASFYAKIGFDHDLEEWVNLFFANARGSPTRLHSTKEFSSLLNSLCLTGRYEFAHRLVVKTSEIDPEFLGEVSNLGAVICAARLNPSPDIVPIVAFLFDFLGAHLGKRFAMNRSDLDSIEDLFEKTQSAHLAEVLIAWHFKFSPSVLAKAQRFSNHADFIMNELRRSIREMVFVKDVVLVCSRIQDLKLELTSTDYYYLLKFVKNNDEKLQEVQALFNFVYKSILDSSVIPSEEVCNLLSDAMIRFGKASEMGQVFANLFSRGLPYSTTIVNSIMKNYAENQMPDQIDFWLRFMDHVGLEKNEETYNILISLHCTLNQLDKALTLLEKVHRKYNGLINTDVLSAVVAKFLEGDAFDEALELMNSVADIDQETCGMMFKYALLKRSEEDAAHLLGLMRSQDFRVDIDLIVEAVFERYGSKCDPIPLIVNLFDKCGARVDPRALALAFAKKNHVPALIQAVNKVFSENLVVSETWKTEVMYALVNANDMELAMEVMTWNIPFGQFAQTSVVPKHAQMQ
eukprot:TRINITY_DN11129_c0_g1_i2.p1 TRINITY_DN11129_c0_g1~~TRINITY_DN11129_c0_g1_i2.p1  ORF type:complete len:644 (+),score=152.23 TRINITY_DN11129_c0_g1_i2:211-1932(+)